MQLPSTSSSSLMGSSHYPRGGYSHSSYPSGAGDNDSNEQLPHTHTYTYTDENENEEEGGEDARGMDMNAYRRVNSRDEENNNYDDQYQEEDDGDEEGEDASFMHHHHRHPTIIEDPIDDTEASTHTHTHTHIVSKLVNLEGGSKTKSFSLSLPSFPSSFSLSTQTKHTLLTLSYFALWFTLNIYYNIINKQVLNSLPLPFTIATTQLGIGALYVLLSWTLHLRARPHLSKQGLHSLLPIAAYHGSGQLFTVLSLGAAAVSFTHIVKAMEPFFSALVAAICFKQIFHLNVYLSLIPVVVGVSVACANDVSFSWPAFLTAMASNLAFALRANFSKLSMNVFKSENNKSMTPANIYGVVTILSFLLLVPLALLWEAVDLTPTWRVATEKIEGKALLWQIFLSGLFHYLNNEVMYLALDNVHPITLAVGNTAKRVFIIVASLLVFRNPISGVGMVGSAVGIGGVLLYSLAVDYYGMHPPKGDKK